MGRKFSILLLNLTLICTLSFVWTCSPATALLRQHHETENVLRYHAQDSLKDRDGNTWQVLLFPDSLHSVETSYYLRLVGFPGINSFVHPQSLEVLTSEGKILTAPDSYVTGAPAPNVGQYTMTTIIDRIPAKGSLKLSTPLKGDRELSLKIPAKVVAEWQLLTREIEKF